MPRQTPTARFVGGPLDGQTYVKRDRGHWSIYLDNEGNKMVPRRGDMLRRTGDPAGCYIHREERLAGKDTWEHVYRHTSTLGTTA